LKFDTSKDTNEFLVTVFARVGARTQAVLGRAALLLALGQGVPTEYKVRDSQGVTLNDEQVLGEDLRDLVRACLHLRSNQALDESSYRREFRRYFEFGCDCLRDVWESSGRDQAVFISNLLKIPGVRGSYNSIETQNSAPAITGEVKLKVLTDEPELSLNGPGTRNGLLVISGEPGSGKSQLALDLLAQLSRQGVRFMFFDLKGELEDDPANAQQRANRTKFLRDTNAQYVRLIENSLPINPLVRYGNAATNAQAAYEMASLVRCFAHQLGARQEQNLADAYQRLPFPDFPSLEADLVNSGATGVELAIIRKINQFQIFSDSMSAIPPEEWLSRSIVIDFKQLGNDSETKSIAVALILNFLMKKLNQNLGVVNGVQPLKMVLFVDEAHLLLPKEGRAGLLGSLARQGRSWGFPVWLASQDADAFKIAGQHETDFADLAECGIHFSPQKLTASQQRSIFGTEIKREPKKGEAAMITKGNAIVGGTRQFWRDSGKK
jgi:hypothetical protein